jgi:hypothetical protein
MRTAVGNQYYNVSLDLGHNEQVSGGRNVDPEALLAELAKYEAEIANIESRFIRITESLFYIPTDDDAMIRHRIEQLIEILNHAFGANNYSRQISADFNRASRNYPPTVHRVRSILWTIRAARQRIEQNCAVSEVTTDARRL